MAHREVTVARIYIREAEHLLADIMKFLHDEEKVAGAVVLRGVAGFSADGIVRTASLIDLALDLPLVVEFYDRPEAFRTPFHPLDRSRPPHDYLNVNRLRSNVTGQSPLILGKQPVSTGCEEAG